LRSWKDILGTETEYGGCSTDSRAREVQLDNDAAGSKVLRMSAQTSGEDKESKREEAEEFQIEEALEESFPASDPPAWTRGRDEDEEEKA
jgi:hypothetical protein